MSLDLSALKRTDVNHATNSSLEDLYLFEWIDATVRTSILEQCRTEVFAPGETVITEGESSNGKAYIITSGKAEVLINNEPVSVLSIGMLFGEYALICAEDRTATVRAIEPMECLVLDEDALIRISNENNKINEIMMERIEDDLRRAK